MKAVAVPKVVFERLDPADLVSALSSLTRLHRQDVLHDPIGCGHECFLRWALQDLQQAEQRPSGDETDRAAVAAVLNARRSLSCLVDQYLKRDGFVHCLGAPGETAEKADILVGRRVFDQLASRVLMRCVSKRNDLEHRYQRITLADAQDMVHTVRATIECATSKSDPFAAPAAFGTILGGYGVGANGVYGFFGGWSGCVFLLNTTQLPAWAGIVVPSTTTDAVVRRVELGELSPKVLLQVLSIAESLMPDERCQRRDGSGVILAV